MMSQDNEHPTPNGLLAYILNELIELKVGQVTLDAMVQAQGQMIDALIVALPVGKRPDALALMRAQCQALQAEGENEAAAMLGSFIDGAKGLLGAEGSSTLREATAALSVNSALMQSAPEGKVEAMRSWLGYATDAEILQEMLALPPEKLDALLRLNTPARPARRGGGARRKKEQDDGG